MMGIVGSSLFQFQEAGGDYRPEPQH